MGIPTGFCCGSNPIPTAALSDTLAGFRGDFWSGGSGRKSREEKGREEERMKGMEGGKGEREEKRGPQQAFGS